MMDQHSEGWCIGIGVMIDQHSEGWCIGVMMDQHSEGVVYWYWCNDRSTRPKIMRQTSKENQTTFYKSIIRL